MEALGLVTWWPWLRRVATVGSRARAGAILAEAGSGESKAGAAWQLTGAVPSHPPHLGPRRGAGRLGFLQPSPDGDGSLQPLPPDDPPWRPRLPSCSCCLPWPPLVPVASRAAVVLPPQGLMVVGLGPP